MFGLGAGEVLVIMILALIFIGPKKLPELAKGLGRGFREFQKAKDEMMNEVNREIDEAKKLADIKDEPSQDALTLEKQTPALESSKESSSSSSSVSSASKNKA